MHFLPWRSSAVQLSFGLLYWTIQTPFPISSSKKVAFASTSLVSLTAKVVLERAGVDFHHHVHCLMRIRSEYCNASTLSLHYQSLEALQDHCSLGGSKTTPKVQIFWSTLGIMSRVLSSNTLAGVRMHCCQCEIRVWVAEDRLADFPVVFFPSYL